MRNFIDLVSIAPDFLWKKIVKAPRDEELPGGYHASLKSWKQMKAAPLLHIAPQKNISLLHMARSIPVGEHREIYLHEVEYPWEATDEQYSLHWNEHWTSDARQRSEDQITRGNALSVAYFYDKTDPNTFCLMVRKDWLRRVVTTKLRITKDKTLPQPVSVSGSEAFTVRFEGSLWDYFTMEEVDTF